MEQDSRHSRVHRPTNGCFVHDTSGGSQDGDDELLKSFELMRSALIADNSRVVNERCEKIIS